MMMDFERKMNFVTKKKKRKDFSSSSFLTELKGYRERGNPLRRLARERLNDPATAPFLP